MNARGCCSRCGTSRTLGCVFFGFASDLLRLGCFGRDGFGREVVGPSLSDSESETIAISYEEFGQQVSTDEVSLTLFLRERSRVPSNWIA